MTNTQPASPTPTDNPAGPLSGIRILDLTHVVMGPFATQTLADQGADVIVVETPTGDTNRIMGAGPCEEFSGVTLNLMRNKRSITLNLKADEDRETAYRLARTCDVVVTTMRPGPLTRLGFDYASIADIQPDIVYCQGQGWPLDDPRANDPAYDDIIQAATGIADLTNRVHGQPSLMPTILADKVCGLVMAQAITAALLHRERTGEGQHIQVPMTTAMTAFMLVEHGAGAISEPSGDISGYRRILSRERRPSRTLDGWVHLLPYKPRDYEALFTSTGRTDLADDPRLADRRTTLQNADTLYADVREIATQYTTDDLIDLCHKIGVPVTRVVTVDDMLAGLPIREHPAAGAYRETPPPAVFSRTPGTLRRPAPGIGENTADVIAELRADHADAALAGR